MKDKKIRVKSISLILVIVVIVLIILLLNVKNIRKLFGSATIVSSNRYSETISEICNTIIDNDYFMTISFSIYQNYGASGDATVILTSADDKGFQFKKNINVDTTSRANFSYSVPKGKYKLTIEKAGFNTYVHDVLIDENTKYFSVNLKDESNSNLIISGHLYLNTYYEYIKNNNLNSATIRIYKKDDAEINLSSEKNTYTVLGKIVKDMLKKNNIEFNYGEGKWKPLVEIIVDIMMAAFISDSRILATDSITSRDLYQIRFASYKAGGCGSVSECFGIDTNSEFYESFGSEENFIDALSLVLDDSILPVNSGIKIENGVEFIPPYLLYGARISNLEIPESVIAMSSNSFLGTDIGTLRFLGSKTNLDYGGENIFEGAYIDKIELGNGISRIGDNMFTKLEKPVNIIFPSSLKEIGSNCFSETEINNGIIDLNNVEKVGDYAFYDSKLNTIKISSNLKEIGDYAFANNQIKESNETYFSNSKYINYLNLPKTINKIGDYAFANNLIPGLKFNVDTKSNLSDIEYIGSNAFVNNYINEVIIPNNELNNIYIGDKAFKNNKIVYVNLGNSVKELKEYAFENNSIKKLVLSNSMEEIEPHVFENNEIIAINLNSNINSIGDYAFQNNKISNLELTDSLIEIGTSAFYNNLITDLKINKNVETISSSAFANNRIKKLEFLVDDDTQKCKLKQIDSNAFVGSKDKTTNVIEELYLPKSENNYYIGFYAFQNNKIRKLTLSESVNFRVTDSSGKSAGAFYNNNVELLKVLGPNKDRYNSIWIKTGLPEDLKVY